MLRIAVLALALASSCVAVVAQPKFSNEVYVKGTMSLPYAGIVEPFEAYLANDRMRVDYYDGMDTYIFRKDLGLQWQVNPEVNTPTCFLTTGQVEIASYLPDTTGFKMLGDAVQVLDQMCDAWVSTVTTLGKTSEYTLYMSRLTGAPVRYTMMGYDSLLGSHFDLYQVDYQNVTNSPNFPTGIFDQPLPTCGGFPGPGFFAINPVEEVQRYYPGQPVPEGIVSDEYAAYLATHGKSYSTDAELRTREMHYQGNMHFVASHQRRFRSGKETYAVALNFLADHMPQELNARRGRLPSTKAATTGAMGEHMRNFYDADLPTSLDWRTKGAVNQPQDQGICGSCWSFGSTGSMEGAYYLKTGQLKVLAAQELMDCSWPQGNNACDGGEDYRAYDWILANGGMSFKENYGPYLMQDGYCQASQHTPDVVMQGYVNVTAFDQKAVMDALATAGPLSVSIDASHPGLSFYSSGVYNDPLCGSGFADLDHSVSAVGFGTDPTGGDYWIIKNSWSTYWGDEGFIKISRSQDCGVATAATYVVLQ